MLKHKRGASLQLTPQERIDLEAMTASRSLPHGLVRRANMILMTESGVSIRRSGMRLVG